MQRIRKSRDGGMKHRKSLQPRQSQIRGSSAIIGTETALSSEINDREETNQSVVTSQPKRKSSLSRGGQGKTKPAKIERDELSSSLKIQGNKNVLAEFAN